MPYKGAFDCVRCPGSNNPTAKRACPAWWETVWTNATGDTKVEKGCGWVQMPNLFNALAQSANGAAVSAQQMRDAAINTMKLTAVKVLSETPYLISDASVRRRGRNSTSDDQSDHRYVSEDCGGVQQPGIRHDEQIDPWMYRDILL
jgi:hypothetical protein